MSFSEVIQLRSVRIIKRREREDGIQAADTSGVVRKVSTEMIIKDWISTSRERRRIEEQLFRRQLKISEQNLSL